MITTPTTTVETSRNPGCLLQILWFAFVGVWLGQAWMIAAWFFMVTIIGIPAGVWMMNKLPKIMALRESPRLLRVASGADGRLISQEIEQPQESILLRAVYFVLIGWWLSALWMEAAYALCVSIIGLPLGFWMLDRVPAVLSLQR